MLKIIPKIIPKDPDETNLNGLDGGAIFLYRGRLRIKHDEACGGTDLKTGEYEELDDAWVIEVNATLTWQKKPKTKTKKKK